MLSKSDWKIVALCSFKLDYAYIKQILLSLRKCALAENQTCIWLRRTFDTSGK